MFLKDKRKATISDFGNQWVIHGRLDDDYWTSDQMFRDHFENKKPPFEDLEGLRVVDVGSGSGRILKMISRYNPKKLIGVEPSQGFNILRENTKGIPNLELVNLGAEEFSTISPVDYVFSLGVIHHIPNPEPAVENIYLNLVPGGYFVMWVYGYENNELYVFLQAFLRPILRLLPDFFLEKFSLLLTYILDVYLGISRVFCFSKLPLTKYLSELFSKCGRVQKKYIIFDQLNPAFAKYYKKEEVIDLLKRVGFSEISLFHRHSYSWTAIAKK